MNVGTRIRNLRKSKKLSTRELATLADISQPVISRLENNSRSADVDLIKRICVALNITLSDFFASDQAQAPELPPEVRRVCGKIQQLPPEKLKVLESVLDTWVESD